MPESTARFYWCPECGEAAWPLPPHAWPSALPSKPAFSHLDGSPLCPVVGENGYEPAQPTEYVPTTE